MSAALGPAMFNGLGLVAVWVHVRFPSRRPRGIAHAMVHVIVAFVLFMLLPLALREYRAAFPNNSAGPYFVVVALMPTLTYVLLSWVWLLARIAHDLGSSEPRGGHPVTDGAR